MRVMGDTTTVDNINFTTVLTNGFYSTPLIPVIPKYLNIYLNTLEPVNLTDVNITYHNYILVTILPETFTLMPYDSTGTYFSFTVTVNPMDPVFSTTNRPTPTVTPVPTVTPTPIGGTENPIQYDIMMHSLSPSEGNLTSFNFSFDNVHYTSQPIHQTIKLTSFDDMAQIGNITVNGTTLKPITYLYIEPANKKLALGNSRADGYANAYSVPYSNDIVCHFD